MSSLQALMGAMLLADAEAQRLRGALAASPQPEQVPLLGYDQARRMAAWALGLADKIAREAYDRIR